MRETLNKLWTAFFVALLLFVVAVVVGTLVNMANPGCPSCGSNVALTFWIIGVGAHQPILWTTNTFSFLRRLSIWLTAVVVGVVTYFGLEALAASLLASGNMAMALRLGFAANLIGMMAAPAVSRVLVRRSSRQRQAASPPAATRQSTHDLRVHSESDRFQKKPSMQRGWRLALVLEGRNVLLEIIPVYGASVLLLASSLEWLGISL